MIVIREFSNNKFNEDRLMYCETQAEAEYIFEKEKDPNLLVVVKHYYCDGSGWNGKESRFCVLPSDGFDVVVGTFNNKLTNNDMEYLAVVNACDMASDGEVIFTDSNLVVQQVNGGFRCSDKFIGPMLNIRDLIIKKSLMLRWIPREKNLAGKRFEK